ncbi:MAG: hypothetical protein KKG09_00495 [Verrucomicrobia bacterium]|nr:hypothetical protein [Verrucomicrobiota bacterium]MBU4430284.1 hypothetical protein [Verrucomicrobiota bacterium]MBU4496470.1 hypothetical protein [Verrucomicrobiota bacterium]MCG2679682.1 glycosyl hydrolase-related protein [Kiritimatiellia bacterium]
MRRFLIPFIAVLLASNLPAQEKPGDPGTLPETFNLVPFSHFDLAWTGTTPECLSRGYRIFTEAMDLCRKDPDYRYLIDNLFFLERYLSSHPEKREAFHELVKKGQIELNPAWILSFPSDNDGELWVRNLLYSKKYIRDEFGVDARCLSTTDLPDWTPQFPQILTKSGIDFVLMTRNGPKNAYLFHWKGQDDTKILTVNMRYGGLAYDPIVEFSRRPQLVKGYLHKVLALAEHKAGARHIVGLAGTDRSLPFPDLTKNVAAWNAMSPVKMKVSTLKEYYALVKDTPDLPTFSGEVPNTWMGVDAGYAKTFQDAQRALNGLETAEKWATICWLIGFSPYPAEPIESAWKSLLQAHDHGYGGHGYEDGDRRKIFERQKAIFTADDILERSLAAIAEHVKVPEKDCIPIVVFNSMSWPRSEVVDAHFTLQILQSDPGYDDNGVDVGAGRKRDFYPIKVHDKIVLKDDRGNPVPLQVAIKYQHLEYRILFRAEDVPPLGYRTYYVSPVKEEHAKPSPLKREKNSIENEFLRVAVSETGAVTLYDKEAKKTVSDGIRLCVIPDLTPIKDGKEMEDLKELPVRLRETRFDESGPIRIAGRLTFSCDHPSIRGLELTLSLAAGERKLGIEAAVDYKMEMRRDILGVSLLFPKEKDAKITYGTPYGYNESTHLLPDAGFLHDPPQRAPSYLPAHIWKRVRSIQKWIDIRGADRAYTIASSRDFFVLGEKDIRCELVHLNAPAFYLCKEIRQGRVESAFSIVPHDRTWQEDKTYRQGWELNSPMTCYSVNDTVSAKTLPATLSFLPSPSDHAVVTVLKKEERGNGVIARFFEAEGKDGSINPGLFRPVKEIQTCDLQEKELHKMDSTEKLDKNEIKTIKFILTK